MHPFVALTLLATALAWVLTPSCARLATRWGIVDKPDVRKIHQGATPYLGGLAVIGAMSVAGLIWFASTDDAQTALVAPGLTLCAIAGGAVLMFLIGLVDDAKHLRARHKLMAQLLAALTVCATGARLDTLHLSDSLSVDLGALSWLLTVLWIVGLTNAVNLIDGLDGLAAGLGTIATAAIVSITIFTQAEAATSAHLAVMCALFGALLGFLPFNHRPAKIFLGDSGSLLIGFLVATAPLSAGPATMGFASMAIPTVTVIALGIPIFDTVFAVMRRGIERRGLMSPDKGHIHHRLLGRGLSHERAVHALWLESFAITVLGLALYAAGLGSLTSLSALTLCVGLHVFFFHRMGAVRLRDSIRAMRSASQRSREQESHRRRLDDLDLQMRERRDREQWSKGIAESAQSIGIRQIALTWSREPSPITLVPRPTPHSPESDPTTAAIRLPVAGESGDVEGWMHFEVAGDDLHRVRQDIDALVTLLERHPAPRDDGERTESSDSARLSPQTIQI